MYLLQKTSYILSNAARPWRGKEGVSSNCYQNFAFPVISEYIRNLRKIILRFQPSSLGHSVDIYNPRLELQVFVFQGSLQKTGIFSITSESIRNTETASCQITRVQICILSKSSEYHMHGHIWEALLFTWCIHWSSCLLFATQASKLHYNNLCSLMCF